MDDTNVSDVSSEKNIRVSAWWFDEGGDDFVDVEIKITAPSYDSFNQATILSVFEEATYKMLTHLKSDV